MASLCKPPFPLVPQIFYSLFASLSFYSCGLCAGWASQTLVNTVTRTWSWGVWAQEVPWIPATLELGALIACVPVGYAVDKYGRKYVNLTVGFLYLLSWLIVLAADMHPEKLYSARVVAGLAMGATAIVVPVYVAEVSEARVRGVLLALTRASGAAGLLSMHALGPAVGYRTLVALSVLPAVLFLCTFSWSPESPHLLAVKERWNKATESLTSLRASARAVKLELAELMRKDEERAKVIWRQLPGRPVARNALLLALALGLLSALSGHHAVVFYSALRLPNSSDPAFIGPDTFALSVAAASLAGCLVCAGLVDVLGRRLMLAASAVSCTLSMAGVGYVFLGVARCQDAADTCGLGWWLVVGLLSWAFCHGLGLLALPAALAVEMAPTNVRGLVASVGVAFAIVGSVLATVALEMLSAAHEACWVYAASSALVLVLALTVVPETRGRSLGEVQRQLSLRYGAGPPPALAAAANHVQNHHQHQPAGEVPLVRHNGRPVPTPSVSARPPAGAAAAAAPGSDAEP